MIVEARKAIGFGTEKITIIVNEALNIEVGKPIVDTTCYYVPAIVKICLMPYLIN